MLEYFVHFLETLRQLLDQLGGWAILAFAGVFVVAQLFMIPVAPLGMAAGLFFGFGRGWVALMLGCAAGASVNYFISARFARGYVHQKLGNNDKFKLIETAIERGGWKIVALLRFIPIPFGLANYCYGLTPIRYLPYLLATCLSITPVNSLVVWMGATSGDEISTLIGKGRPRHPMEYVLLGVGLLAAVIVLRYVSKIAKSAVDKTNAEHAG